MFALVLVLMGGDAFAAAQDKLAAERPCAVDPNSTDVTVCGRRQADRFRVPLVVRDPGDPRHEAVMAERTRLLARTTPLAEKSPFLIGGGAKVGVAMTTGAGGTRVEGARELAP